MARVLGLVSLLIGAAPYLDPLLADGFANPIGDPAASYVDPAGRTHRGWYLATRFGDRYRLGIHPGEDWNGEGGGDSDLGQPVYATARGRVVSAAVHAAPWGGVVVLEHVYLENHELRRIRSVYAHLSRIDLREGARVERGAAVGAIGKSGDGAAHLHFELRSELSLEPTYWPSSHGKDLAWIRARYLEPRAFLAAHAKTFVPAEEPVVLLVDNARYQLRRYARGRLTHTHEVAFGQAEGAKLQRGDNRTPRGLYFVTDKHRGELTGAYAAYYGGHWIKLNYPNGHDAERGVRAGWIDRARADAIARAWAKRALTDQETRLGGGIGLHGWAHEWSLAEDGGHLSWGCVVMHLADIRALFDEVPVGAMLISY